jgi:uncharacterized protein (DUF58 family)
MASLTPIWRPTRLAVRLVTVAMLGMVAAVAFRNVALIPLAAPALLAVAFGGYRPRPTSLQVNVRGMAERVFEDDDVELGLVVDTGDRGTADTLVVPQLPAALSPASTAIESRPAGLAENWTIHTGRWGRWRVGPWTVRCTALGLMWQTEHYVEFPAVQVYPRPSRARFVPLPARLKAQLGSHVSRRPGSGNEFSSVRGYLPGDSARRVNWRVSQRRGSLFVNEYLAERTAAVVALVDTTVDVGGPENSSLDASVRAAVAVTQAYLEFTDQVGAVAFGGYLRWLQPRQGDRHFYRVVEMLMAARSDYSVLDPDLDRLPRQSLPAGALVFCFSPLLSAEVIASLADMRERGHVVAVVDTLTAGPDEPSDRIGKTALRMWRMEREALWSELRALGIPVHAVTTDMVDPLSQIAVELRRTHER